MARLRRLETTTELDEVFRESGVRPVFLLKHSTRCGSSAASWRDFRDFASLHDEEDALYTVVEIPEWRELSDEVARRTGITHESPQVLLLRGGHVVWHASRWRISRQALAKALEPDTVD